MADLAPLLLAPSTWFSHQTFYAMLRSGWILDARRGGLVLGRSHAGGNIYMIQESGDSGYQIKGHMEGYEFILNYAASVTHRDRIEEINRQKPTFAPPLTLSAVLAHQTVTTAAEPFDKLLWIDVRGQFVVNRWATCANLDELARMNSDAESEFHLSELHLC
jgi:hypothetical protein